MEHAERILKEELPGAAERKPRSSELPVKSGLGSKRLAL